MGELAPGARVLPDHGSVHGSPGWTDAHQTAGGVVRREAGESELPHLHIHEAVVSSYIHRLL